MNASNRKKEKKNHNLLTEDILKCGYFLKVSIKYIQIND